MIPCIVQDLSDEQFLDVLNFDNSNREDVHPLHEAAGWQQWIDKTGSGANDIAERIGKSKEYVYQRLKYAALIPDAKKAFLDARITGAHAILIARLQPKEQEKALNFAVTPDWRNPRDERPGVRQLAHFIQQDIHLQMSAASFDLDSTDLVPAAGTCTACPKRTKNSPDLLLAVEVAANPSSDECMDPGCFHAKVNAHLVQIQAKYEEQGVKLFRISSGLISKKGADYGTANFETISEVPKDDLQPGLFVDGQKIGRVVYVKLVQPKEFHAAPAPAPPPARPSQASIQAAQKLEEQRLAEAQRISEQQHKADEARDREEAKREAKKELERSFRRKVLDEIRAKVTDLSRLDVEALLGDYLHNADFNEELPRLFGEQWDSPMERRGGLEQALSKLRDVEIFQMAVMLPLLDELDDFKLDKKPELLLSAAKRYKVDSAKIRIQIESAGKKAAAAPEVAKPAPPVKKAAAKKPAAKKVAKKKGK